jgi:hypothetical protein
MCLFILFAFTGCEVKKDNQAALDFKEEYESLNGVKNSRGVEHRTITIPEDNPYEKVDPNRIVEMIENKESFYLYVGDSLCPWCRSVLEKSIEVAKESNIEKIYYVEIWDDEGTEIFRDKYELQEGVPVQTIEGVDAYHTLLETFDKVLSDYTLRDEDGKTVEVGEKRIYAPNYFYIQNGKVVRMVEGYSSSLEDPRGELTEEVLQDEEKQFMKLFTSDTICTEEGC